MNIAMILPPCPGEGVKRLCGILLDEAEKRGGYCNFTVVCREGTFAEEERTAEILPIRVTKSEPTSSHFRSKVREKFGAMPMRCDYADGMKRALAGRKFDAVILENCPEFARIVRRICGIEPILHAHDRFFGRDRKNWRRCVGVLKKVLFVSDFLRDEAAKCGLPENLSATLQNCVDTAAFDASLFETMRHEKRTKYGIADEEMLGVFVGLLTPEKGACELVKAVAMSEYEKHPPKLLLVGSAHYGENVHDDYRTQLEYAAPEGRVIFIGSVKPTSTARFLARADFAVIPSVFDEPAGLPVLEALSCGLPVIVSDAGGIHEYAGADCPAVTTVPRGLGYVAALSRAIDELCARLEDESTRRELSAAARAQAMKFSADGYLERFLDNIT